MHVCNVRQGTAISFLRKMYLNLFSEINLLLLCFNYIFFKCHITLFLKITKHISNS